MSQGIAGSPAKSNPVAIGLARGWIKPAEPAKQAKPKRIYKPRSIGKRKFLGALAERKRHSRAFRRVLMERNTVPIVQNPDLVKIAAEECALASTPLVAVLGKCRTMQVVMVRDKVIVRAVLLGMSHSAISREFGISKSAVTYAVKRSTELTYEI